MARKYKGETYFSKNDILGCYGLGHSQQNYYARKLGITPKKLKIGEAREKEYFSGNEVSRILKARGWVEKNGLLVPKFLEVEGESQ